MSKASMSHKALPVFLENGLNQLGEDIRTARLRRGISRAEMAQRMLVDLHTIDRLENGKPGVSIGVLASSLYILGLHERLILLVDPDSDKEGIREMTAKQTRKSVSGPSQSMDF
jgi:transcriptional regulator with XRE-family HTH domain